MAGITYRDPLLLPRVDLPEGCISLEALPISRRRLLMGEPNNRLFDWSYDMLQYGCIEPFEVPNTETHAWYHAKAEAERVYRDAFAILGSIEEFIIDGSIFSMPHFPDILKTYMSELRARYQDLDEETAYDIEARLIELEERLPKRKDTKTSSLKHV